jgi:hypothetical protein
MQADPALAGTVLMVRPAAFGANPETAATNRFQSGEASNPALVEAARREFDGLAEALERAGIEVMVGEDTAEPAKPDAIFPNNWFSTHADGTLVLYPMHAPNRRLERRPELVAEMAAKHGRRITAILNMSPWEQAGLALEGTGSLILDRAHRVAYACLSPRTERAPLAQWAERMNYRVETFTATDPGGVAVYHTNVMFTLGRGFAAIALESIENGDERARIVQALEAGGHEILPLSEAQVAGFSGNMLHLVGNRGPVVAMSDTARRHLGSELLRRLEGYGSIVSAPIDTIERSGGGSVRCMLAEIFLPR